MNTETQQSTQSTWVVTARWTLALLFLILTTCVYAQLLVINNTLEGMHSMEQEALCEAAPNLSTCQG